MNCDSDLLRAWVFHGLKSISNPGDTLPPKFLEFVICKSFDLDHVGDGYWYADGVKGANQASIKTRMLNPHTLKRKQGRDFQSHPTMFLGPHQNVKQNKWTGGLEIVQRRQALPFKDAVADAKKIGIATLKAFEDNIKESYEKFQSTKSYEIVSVHGYNCDRTAYIMSVYWQEHKPLDPNKLSWVREGLSVAGYATVDGNQHKLAERINGNAKREATCFKEYKNLTKYANSLSIKVPIPDPWSFDKDTLLTEIQLLESI
jgi:hypothetical protein